MRHEELLIRCKADIERVVSNRYNGYSLHGVIGEVLESYDFQVIASSIACMIMNKQYDIRIDTIVREYAIKKTYSIGRRVLRNMHTDMHSGLLNILGHDIIELEMSLSDNS